MELSMKLFLLLFITFFGLGHVAADTGSKVEEKMPVATLYKMDGLIKVLPKGSIRKHKAKVSQAIYAGDMVLSYKKSHVLLKLNDGSKVVLDESSSIRFYLNTVEQESGKVYYDIQKRSAKNALKVKTAFAIIGIKGTTFIVQAEPNFQSVSLQKGKIEIASVKERFELHRKKVLAEFKKYKSEQNQGFEAYKKQAEEKIVSHVNSFIMESGKKVTFSDNIADEDDFNRENEASFEAFKRVIESLH